ncbi:MULTISPECIES: phosphotransferase enzyme family protein [Vibrio]|uniref:Aminoglycoside phosphotransferase n=1 Tax=Vibrio bivalvicida TaxID=1276888 RepID=A0A177XX94_9VIBR|nr:MULTISPECIES: phosphotransferase [Vibrio]KLN63866.1 aminoglycoside phosphotransferase [Vibrio sp. VPAP30]OAJ93201.1 aminoglycoside phosphotransferase [Vibrio bivalvicida]
MAAEPVQRRIQFVFDQYQIFPNDNLTLCYFGMANEVYIVPTEHGRYVLKKCFKSNTKELISNEVALIEQLNSNGCSTPEIVPDKEGNLYVDFDGEIYVMTKYCSDMTYNWSSEIPDKAHQETIRAMANFHHATEQFTPPYPNSRTTFLGMATHRDKLAQIEACVVEGRESFKQMSEYLPKLKSLLNQLESEINQSELDKAKQCFIHGDLHCYNLFYDQDGGYTKLIDFDFSRLDYRLADIFWTSRILGFKLVRRHYSIEQLEAWDHVIPEDLLLNLLVQVWQIIIRQYRQVSSLNDSELALVPLFAQAVPLYIFHFFDFTNSEQECLEHVKWFEWELSQVERNVRLNMLAIEKVLSDVA